MASSSGGGMSRETQMSIEASSMFPGFRFSPTDAELISYYLRKKVDGDEKCVEVIPQVEICRHEPWDLPAKSIVQSETEWFFFSSRGRKYPNGSQSKRATQLGYWKATGKERSVRSGSAVIGTKRTLVFHIGRAPRGERTEWIMHEYCTYSGAHNLQDSLVVCRLRKNMDFRGHHGICDGVISGNNNNNNGNGTAMENNGAESSKKTTDSSSDSYSIEQPGGGGAESSSRMARHDPFELKMLEESCRGVGFSKNHVDDFYADILKDDIVSLDDDGLAAPAVSVSAAATMQGFAPLWVVQQQQQQGTANRRVKLESRRRVGNVAAAVRELEEEAKENEREDEEKKREKKKVPSCAVGLVMFVKKKRGKGVATLFVATVLVVAVLLTLFGSLFGHDKVSGKIRKVAHLPSLSFRSGT
ncbi:unnamed protein product [Linum trigynum]|uniref:NAC domain-containing protein n=1 Tax=Linum trigynum TaxID=586398 RepID=A0AAV2D4P2_9ROSI